ncbi:MAG: PD-(D/E)XK nuclease family protein [Betaproteobacteria bacterium]|nr:PD-(D/E)XK nuclease family protein [Betaproteobacteria bacterium]
MTDIENSDLPRHFPVAPGAQRTLPCDLPAAWHWFAPEHGVLARIAQTLQLRNCHPGRSLVLLPYAQLLRQAQTMWATRFPTGFAPRFETSMNWSTALAPFTPGPSDIRFEAAADTLTARSLLTSLQGGPGAQWEAIALSSALEWAAASRYATDVLLRPDSTAGWDCVIALQGLNEDPLLAGLAQVWGERMVRLPLALELEAGTELVTEWGPSANFQTSRPLLCPLVHPCKDAADEAQRVSACVIAHISAERYPLALICSDRALTRRISALLEGAGALIRDETGWMLSTTVAGAGIAALLRAAAWGASSDAVLAWLKLTPAWAARCSALEAWMRRHQLRDWSAVVAQVDRRAKQVSTFSTSTAYSAPDLTAQAMADCVAAVQSLRSACAGRRDLAQWLAVLTQLLQDCGMFAQLAADPAGAQVLAITALDRPQDWSRLQAQWVWGAQPLDLGQFSAWLQGLLEGGRFRPDYPQQEQVVLLPMSQILTRPFAAVLLAGCDEVRLPRVPERSGTWTEAQRLALGLPARAQLAQATSRAWEHALDHPFCEVFWRVSDDSGELLAPSPLVRLLQTQAPLPEGFDSRVPRWVEPRPVVAPQPQAPALLPATLSQSAYEDLRACPYRFFAQRQLGLRAADELEAEIDKRDFGQWLHGVLEHFHRALARHGDADLPLQRQLLAQASADTTAQMGLDEGEFLPFAAAWSAMAEPYLQWLSEHQAHGNTFTQAEVDLQRQHVSVRLVGRVDRIDRTAQGQSLIVDYKTESQTRSKSRVKDPLEDTQMAFYAALQGQEDVQGGYLSIHERDGCKLITQEALGSARDALLQGITEDFQAMAQGAALPALGEGASCEYCQVRGLCRKDFWAIA